MDDTKCIMCGQPGAGYKCDMCGSEADGHDPSHACGPDHHMVKCVGCGEAQVQCPCDAPAAIA